MLNGIQKLLNKFRKIKRWHWCNIYKTAKIGKDVKIGSYVEIGDEVAIGDRTMVEAKVFIPKGVFIGKDCFVGPGTIFTNDKNPPSGKCMATIIKNNVSIGANCTILPGIIIEENVTVGAGSVVTKSLPADTICYGNPAKPQKIKRKK